MSYELIISHTEVIFRLFLAAILGGLIGWERERASWFAGLRTHMLVCMGSTLIMLVSKYGFEDVVREGIVMLDPSRVAAQVVSGIGFLGAGTILFWKNMIRGLTTAASLWVVAAVGLAIGSGLYLAAGGTTIMIFIVLAGIKPIERKFFEKKFSKEIKFSIKAGYFSLIKIEDILGELKLYLSLADLQIEMGEERETVHLFFKPLSDENTLKILDKLKKIHGIEKIEVIG